jgi:hypothetical protein
MINDEIKKKSDLGNSLKLALSYRLNDSNKLNTIIEKVSKMVNINGFHNEINRWKEITIHNISYNTLKNDCTIKQEEATTKLAIINKDLVNLKESCK